MNKWLMIFILALFLMMPGCSGCDKSTKETPQKPTLNQPTPMAVQPAEQEEETGDQKAEEKEEDAQEAAPTKEMSGDESKEKVLAIMPDVVKSFSSQEFKEKMQDAAKSRDFKQLTQVMQDVIKDACSKHGLSFEQCVKLMNEHKDDPEIKETMEKWRSSMDFSK